YQSLTSLPSTDFSSVLTARNNYDGEMIQLLWKPMETLSIRATYMNQVSDYNGWPMSDFYLPPNNPDGIGIPFRADSLLQRRTYNIPEFDNQHWYFGGVTVNWTTPVGVFTSATNYFDETAYNREDISEWTQNAFYVFFGVPTLPNPIDSWNHPHSFV